MPAFDPALLNTLVARELAKDKERARFESPAAPQAGPSTHPLSPVQSMLLGSGLDAASTYGFLKRQGPPVLGPVKAGSIGTEGNPMWKGAGPALTSLGVGLIGPALHYGLGKISPKLADLVGAQMGARQTALGGENLYNPHSELSSDARVSQKLDPSIKASIK